MFSIERIKRLMQIFLCSSFLPFRERLASYCTRPARAFWGHGLGEHRTLTRQSSLSRLHHFQSRIEFMTAGRAADAIRFNCKFV